MTDGDSFGFPLAIDAAGRIGVSGGDEAIRGKIVQVLFTAPGERVNLPEFGCGLFNQVFEPNDDILAGTLRFAVGSALARWLADDIVVDAVDAGRNGEFVTLEVAYTKRQDLARQAVRIHFR